jgi:CBS domain-containing protein
MPINTVKQILQTKGDEVWFVSPNQSVLDAIKLMTDKGIGALLVMDGSQVVGILSERDVARKLFIDESSPATTNVVDIMTKRVYTASLDETANECLAVMTEMRIRHLPVVEDGVVVGVVSIGDLVKAVISHQQFMIEQLTNYIES